MGVRPAAGRGPLDPETQVRILDPQPIHPRRDQPKTGIGPGCYPGWEGFIPMWVRVPLSPPLPYIHSCSLTSSYRDNSTSKAFKDAMEGWKSSTSRQALEAFRSGRSPFLAYQDASPAHEDSGPAPYQPRRRTPAEATFHSALEESRVLACLSRRKSRERSPYALPSGPACSVRGDSALQASCGGCNSLRVHQILTAP